jgi:DNA-binding beta-propeller fold protein YncE
MRLLYLAVAAFVSMMFIGMSFSASTPVNIWVANYHSSTVTRLSDSGTVLGTYAVNGGPEAIAVDSAGNVWVATQSGTVVKLSSAGVILGTYAAGRIPESIAIDPSGNVWIADWGAGANGTILKLSSSGVPLGTYVVGNYPQTLAIDSQGNVWVATNSGGVIKLSNNGTILGRYPISSAWGIAVSQNGDVWATDIMDNKLVKFSSNGTVLGNYSIGVAPEDIAIDNNGNVWVTDYISSNVTELSSNGVILGNYPVNQWPEGIAVDPINNDIWVANYGNNSISELSDTGATLNLIKNQLSPNGATILGPESIAIGYQQYPTQIGKELFTGQNLTSGPWTVVLNGLGAPNSSGIAPASFTIYYNNSVVNYTSIYPGVSAGSTIVYNNHFLFINLTKTFPGLYSYQKWAQLSLSNFNVSVTPQSLSINQSATATFTVHASGGNGNYIYKWFNDTAQGVSATGTIMQPSGGTTSDIFKILGSATGTFSYYVCVSSASGALLQNSSVSSVCDINQPTRLIVTPVNKANPANGTIFIGQSLTSGPWKVTLDGINISNKSGVYSAMLSAYFNGTFAGGPLASNPDTASEWISGNSALYVYVNQVFPGLYSYQKWAQLSIAVINSTSPGSIIFVGNSLIFPYVVNKPEGPWRIVLQDIGQSNSTGLSPASFAVYYDGILVNVTSIGVNKVASFSYEGHSISIDLLQTFPGLYSYQKWAQFTVSNGTDLYVGGSTLDGPWKITLADLGYPNSEDVSPAAFILYYNGAFAYNATLNVGRTATFEHGNSTLNLTVVKTFPGLYANQKWAQFYLNLTNRTQTLTTTIPPTTISTVPTENVTINIKPGWNLLSVPFGPQSNESLNNIYNAYYELENSCGMVQSQYSKAIWFYSNSNNTYVWPNSNGAFDNYVSTGMFNLISGVVLNKDFGFWFHSTKQCQIEDPTFLSSVLQAYNQSYTENLSVGWNIIGVPFITNSSFKSIASSCSIRGAFYGYNTATNSYYNATTPAVGESYFVYANAPCALDWIPSTNSGSPPSVP